jgi:hypothetical protein
MGACSFVGGVMRAREKRTRRWRYGLRDLAGLAEVGRLLTADMANDRQLPEVSDDDTSTDESSLDRERSRP